MENLVKDLFAHKVERCSQLYTIIQKLEGLNWEEQYDCEADYIDDIRSYQIELSILECILEELKFIINLNK